MFLYISSVHVNIFPRVMADIVEILFDKFASYDL